jgi:stalled ribosome rescue protein Dom34
MGSYVIWLDSKESRIFELVPDGPKIKYIHAHGIRHKLPAYGDHNSEHHHGHDKFFKEIADSINDAKELIVLGPSEAKVHFKAYLEKHFANTLAKKLVAVETVDHPTDNQILAHARRFFKAYDLLHE